MPNLYKHQQKIIKADPKKALLALGTGSGKSFLSSMLSRGKTLVICPKTQAQDGTWEKAWEMAEKDSKQLTVISKEQFKIHIDDMPVADTLIIDECFLAGTQVLTLKGYKKIEDIKKNDIVKNATGDGKIIAVTKRKVTKIYIIKLSNNKIIYTTANHPFLTTNGWTQARHLINSSLLVSNNMLSLEYEKFMYYLWKADSQDESSWKSLGTLQKNLFFGMLQKKKATNFKKNERRIQKKQKKNFSTFLKKNEKKQSNEKSGNKEKSISNFKKNRTQTKDTGRQWKRINKTSRKIIQRIKQWLGNGICCSNKNDKTRLSELLQNRYSKRITQNSDRSRWTLSWFIRKTTTRQEKGQVSYFVRVESVEISERGNYEVYNLSVSGHPSYIVEEVIVHNCHLTAGIQPSTYQRNYIKYPKTSQIYTAIQSYITQNKPKRLYLLTATPIPTPMTFYGLASILGYKWDFTSYRDFFYWEWKRNIYRVKSNEETKKRLAVLVNRIGYVGRLQDFFDVPEQTYKTEEVGTTSEQEKMFRELRLLYPNPLIQLGKRHQLEQGIYEGTFIKENKIKAIERYAQEFDQLIVFARYTAQIQEYAKRLPDTYTLTGATKNRGELFDKLRKKKKYILIAQSSVSTGWELPDCPCVIFASESYRAVDREQAEGRILRANKLKKNLYITLIAGEADKKVRNVILNNNDFVERIHAERLSLVKNL